jgi:hypothetical protein
LVEGPKDGDAGATVRELGRFARSHSLTVAVGGKVNQTWSIDRFAN